MDVAVRLREEAALTDERRMLVLAGDRSRALARTRDILDALEVDPADAAYVGPDDPLACRAVTPQQAGRLMGTTQQLVLLDCHDRCEPNVLGQVTGTVDGGGLLVLLTPPLDAWPEDVRFTALVAVEDHKLLGGTHEPVSVPVADRTAVQRVVGTDVRCVSRLDTQCVEDVAASGERLRTGAGEHEQPALVGRESFPAQALGYLHVLARYARAM